MFPLAGKDFPKSADDLAAAIEAALADVFSLPGKKAAVTASGGTYPALKAVKVNLDGATVTATEPPPKPLSVGKRHPGVTVEKLDVSARPVEYQKAQLNLKVSGTGLTFEFGRDAEKRPLLVLRDAEKGKVEASIAKDAIQSLLLAAATAAAEEQGVGIQDLHVDLASDGPRSVAATVRIKAKKLMMSGVIVVTGRLDVDDDLNATVSNLACTGEGVVGGVAAGMIKKHIAPFDGTTVPLMAFSLGDVRLRDLKIAVGNDVEVSAAFGNGK